MNASEAPAARARAPARLAQSLSLLRCGADFGGLRPRGCPFESRHTTAQHLTPPQPRRARPAGSLWSPLLRPTPSHALLGPPSAAARRRAPPHRLFISDHRRRSAIFKYRIAASHLIHRLSPSAEKRATDRLLRGRRRPREAGSASKCGQRFSSARGTRGTPAPGPLGTRRGPPVPPRSCTRAASPRPRTPVGRPCRRRPC